MIIQGVTLRNVGLVQDVGIVTSGLTYYIDAGNTLSYSGSGSSMNDLAGSGLGAATLYNSPTFTSAGTGSYFTFNGSNQYVFTPNLVSKFNSPSNSNVTLEMWNYIPSDNGCLVVEEGSASPDGGWYDSVIEIVSNTLKMSQWANGVVPTTAGTYPRSSWAHSVLTYDGTTLRTYLNNVAGSTATLGRSLPWNNSAGLYYGIMCGTGTNLGDGTYLAGRWAQFRLYNRALTATEVTQNYTATKWRYGL
jgi:hypothetical protein